ncbi:hypothetical protein MSAN_01702900 [Mycena sanguinolenta]|uniref:Uncharacterized protein n=1 Tax=Mycena sanguinolenta TaxID=230812 RepID=A0A8H6XZ47_9AGAR|nr:hypothetical protein MSAN_01702900 [Mycena sanguinolenta]
MVSSDLFPLNDDIVGQILRFCPNFDTLQAAIHSITREVAYNLVGPALPQALRVVRYPYFDHCTKDSDPFVMAAACPEVSDPLEVINPDKQEMLDENVHVVEKLEDIYSLMVKDRTSTINVLTAEESRRFRRAMYRIMLYCNIFSSYDYPPEQDEQNQRTIIAQRTAILDAYPTDELRQLESALWFLTEIFDICGCHVETYLPEGPAGALDVWEARSRHVIDLHLGVWKDGFIDTPLKNLWSTRKIAPQHSELLSEGILDFVNDLDVICSQCAAPCGVAHYNKPTWCLVPMEDNLLSDNLAENVSIRNYFDEMVRPNFDSPAAVERFIRRLFALRTGPYASWDPTGSYCFPCFMTFVQYHMRVWLLRTVKYGQNLGLVDKGQIPNSDT